MSGASLRETVRSARAISVRNLRGIVRLPSAFMPALMMPIFTMIAFAGTFAAITKLPGFPTDRSVNWFMPLGICFGSAFSGIGQGFSAIRDIQTGFYDRLRMSPAPRASIILGALLASWFRALLLNLVVVPVGVLLGVRFTGGLLGILTLLAASLGTATMALGWGLGLAYRFRDMRAAAVMQLTMFVVLYLSSAQMPLALISGWLHAVARINPMTNILRLAREGLVTSASGGNVAWANTWGGLVAIVALSALTLAFAWRSLDRLSR